MEARLWSVAAAVIYGAVLTIWQRITGDGMLDGAIGVVIGLYTCSHPASYFLGLLFAERGATRAVPGDPSGWGWAILNLGVMIIGWLVVVAGAMQMATAVSA